jgi:hypothetical protein
MRILRVFLFIAGFVLLLVFSGQPSQASSPASISLTLSNPTCRQEKSNTGTCYINLRSLSASSDDPTFSHVEISIDGKVRAYYSAFFEASINANFDMMGPGLRVTCGLPNAGGDPKNGNIYPVVVTVFLGDVPSLTNTANVTCPYFVSTSLLPLVSK